MLVEVAILGGDQLRSDEGGASAILGEEGGQGLGGGSAHVSHQRRG
jgi:hypothetical protein